MKIMIKLLATLSLIAINLSVALVAAETLELGQATVSVDLSGIGPYNVEKEDPITEDHKYKNYEFAYELFPANIKPDKSSGNVQVEVHQISIPQPLDKEVSQGTAEKRIGLQHCVEKSGMMPAGKDIEPEPYSIDGHNGILITAKDNRGNPLYLAAYSPDINADGIGSTVVVIGASLPWDTAKPIFESVRTML